MIGRLKQAIRARIHAIRCKINIQLEELMFQASIRAIKETHWMTCAATEKSAAQAIEGMRQALDAYEPPTPWVDEVTQVLDSVIAEQFRLQSQIENLERLLHEALAERTEGSAAGCG